MQILWRCWVRVALQMIKSVTWINAYSSHIFYLSNHKFCAKFHQNQAFFFTFLSKILMQRQACVYQSAFRKTFFYSCFNRFLSSCPYFEPLRAHHNTTNAQRGRARISKAHKKILSLAREVTTQYAHSCFYVIILCVCVQMERGWLLEYCIQSVHRRNITKLKCL